DRPRLAEEAGLADPGPPLDRDEPPGAARGRLEIGVQRGELALALEQDRPLGADRRRRRPARAEPRELVRQPLADELEDRLRAVEAGDAGLPELAHAQGGRQLVLDERSGRAREQDLPAVAEVADPRGLVHREADIALAVHGRLARVQPHPDADGAAVRPRMRRERSLRRRGAGDGRARAAKDEEEGVALSVDLDALVLGEGRPEERVVLAEEPTVLVPAELLQQARRALDVREEKGDRPAREVPRSRHLILSTPSVKRPALLARDGTAAFLDPEGRRLHCGSRDVAQPG